MKGQTLWTHTNTNKSNRARLSEGISLCNTVYALVYRNELWVFTCENVSFNQKLSQPPTEMLWYRLSYIHLATLAVCEMLNRCAHRDCSKMIKFNKNAEDSINNTWNFSINCRRQIHLLFTLTRETDECILKQASRPPTNKKFYSFQTWQM